MAIVLVVVFVLGIGAAAYAGFRDAEIAQPSAEVAEPSWSLVVPGDDPTAIAVSVAPAPVASISSVPRPPAATSQHAARPPVATTRPARTATARPTPTPVWETRVIAATSVLTTGQSWSTNRLRLTVTVGGNLVLLDQGRTVWQTGTTTGVKLVMQNDGHLVLYDARNGTAWSSGTEGNPGAVLILQANGNMVISLNGYILFQTGTGY